MLRSTFFALGLFVGLWGVTFLYVDKIVMSGDHEERARGFRGMLTSPQLVERKTRDVLDPPEWAAFFLMSVGSVTMLYSVALPQKAS